MRQQRVTTLTPADVLKRGADKRCPECGGTGLVAHPDRHEDLTCGCVDPRVLRALDTPPYDWND